MDALNHNLAVVQDLEPKLLWRWFAQIASIPHPSHHEEQLANFIVDWASARHLEAWRDAVGNAIIKKPATAGMEACTPIALQAHLDMVPQANADTPHDFATEAIKLRLSEDRAWLMASNTTLGADNGIGMASCLAVLESDDIAHPALEVLLTMTEETGMTGVKGLAADTLTAPIMINTDTEEIGEIYVGCAGGIDGDVTLDIHTIVNPYQHAVRLSIKGLKGGHSGIDIHKNRGNAIKILARILAGIQGDFGITALSGGTLRNAIARESQVVLCFNDNAILTQIHSLIQLVKTEQTAEDDLRIHLESVEKPCQVLDNHSGQQAVHLLNVLPSGVVRYSDHLEDTVETSVSLGVANTDEHQLRATLLIRSLTDVGKAGVMTTVDSVAKLAGASVDFDGDYVGWNFDPASAITAITAQCYEHILGAAPKIKVIHAGLECGLIKKNYPNMDIVSIGPTIKNAHSPDEMVNIDSVSTYWQLLIDVLAKAPPAS